MFSIGPTFDALTMISLGKCVGWADEIIPCIAGASGPHSSRAFLDRVQTLDQE